MQQHKCTSGRLTRTLPSACRRSFSIPKFRWFATLRLVYLDPRYIFQWATVSAAAAFGCQAQLRVLTERATPVGGRLMVYISSSPWAAPASNLRMCPWICWVRLVPHDHFATSCRTPFCPPDTGIRFWSLLMSNYKRLNHVGNAVLCIGRLIKHSYRNTRSCRSLTRKAQSDWKNLLTRIILLQNRQQEQPVELVQRVSVHFMH